MQKKEISFRSADGIQRIHAVEWLPEGEPKAILQIVHGMAEYVERYEDFATFMTEHGYIVVGEDHLGHGKSVGENGKRGFFCEGDAASIVVRDVHRLHEEIVGEYPTLPCFILGHSMGSFITRNYLTEYGFEVQGAVIMSTGMQPRLLLRCSKLFAKLEGAIRGYKHESAILDYIVFGSYCKKIPEHPTSFEWLTRDEEIVAKYVASPDCGFKFTDNGFITLFELLLRLHDTDRLLGIPKNLPLFFVAGTDDPVGNYTKGVEAAVRSVEKAGVKNIKKKYYAGMRHEILNEKEHQIVYEDLLSFFDDILVGAK